MLNSVDSIEYSREITDVYTHEYPITLPMGGIGQLSTLNLPIVTDLLVLYENINQILPNKLH